MTPGVGHFSSTSTLNTGPHARWMHVALDVAASQANAAGDADRVSTTGHYANVAGVLIDERVMQPSLSSRKIRNSQNRAAKSSSKLNRNSSRRKRRKVNLALKNNRPCSNGCDAYPMILADY